MNSNISVTKQTNKQANRNTYVHIKIEFQNLIERLSFLCRVTDIKITWINPALNLLLGHVKLLPVIIAYRFRMDTSNIIFNIINEKS